MLRIAVVDDDPEFARDIERRINTSINWEEKVVHVCTTPEAFLSELDDGMRYDICFFDVVMPGINGIELAAGSRLLDSDMRIVFLSSYVEYACEGYDVIAFSYILKNKLDEKWEGLMERLKKSVEEPVKRSYVVETKSRIEKFFYEDIIYVYKQKKNTVFVIKCREGEREVMQRANLKSVEEKLSADPEFLRVERGIIINMREIDYLHLREINMKNGQKFLIGRNYEVHVRTVLHKYWRDK